eukprot:scaffold52751_cov69-Phaeocystis_antarctica.AAC.3
MFHAQGLLLVPGPRVSPNAVRFSSYPRAVVRGLGCALLCLPVCLLLVRVLLVRVLGTLVVLVRLLLLALLLVLLTELRNALLLSELPVLARVPRLQGRQRRHSRSPGGHHVRLRLSLTRGIVALPGRGRTWRQVRPRTHPSPQ